MSRITIDELLEQEHAGWQSLCASTGGTFYSELMTPDAVFVLVNGAVMTRTEIAESLDGAPGWDSYEISDARLVEVGPAAAALVYRATSTRADRDEPFIALMSSVYLRVDGELRLTLYQQTAIAHGIR